MRDKHPRGVEVGASILNPNSPGRITNNDFNLRAKSKKGLLMVPLNVNGLRSHLDEIKFLVKSMGIDILALNETKLDHSIEKQLTEITGYKQLRLDRSRSGGEIPIYVRDTLKFQIRNDIPDESIELLCIEIQPLKCTPFLFVAWYRPPNDPVCTFHKFDHKFERVLSFLDKENKEIILMGDINCDLSQEFGNISSDSNTRHLLNLYQLFSLKQIIKEPTRVTLTTLILIDHFATTCTDNIVDSGVHKVALSDHYMVFCK